jgi:hypothetical protein
MSTGTDTTPAARTAPDNLSLADTLISLAALLRLNPQISDLYSVSITPHDHRAGTWSIQLHPYTSDEEASTDAVRTFAALFGSDAAVRLEPPRPRHGGGTYRQLDARATHARMRLELWTHIAHTPAPTGAEPHPA